jgi:hypothetical protein
MGGVAVEERPSAEVVADVVHEDVSAAVLVEDCRRQPLDVSLHPDVDDLGVGAAARGAYALDGVLGPLLVDLGDDDVGARGREGVSTRSADAASPARHDRDLAGQIDLNRD